MNVLSKPGKHLNHGSLNGGPRSAATHVNYVYTIKITQYLRPSVITLTVVFPRVVREAAITDVVVCHKNVEDPLSKLYTKFCSYLTDNTCGRHYKVRTVNIAC
jgi:hypothetical protein